MSISVITPKSPNDRAIVLNFCRDDITKVYRVGGVIGMGTYGKVRICCMQNDLS
jgi:calcium-dependent protein kinase